MKNCAQCSISLLCHSEIEISRYWCTHCVGWWLVRAGVFVKGIKCLGAPLFKNTDMFFTDRIIVHGELNGEDTEDVFMGYHYGRIVKECPKCKVECSFTIGTM